MAELSSFLEPCWRLPVKTRLLLTISIISLVATSTAALAKRDSLDVQTGFGEELVVKHGLFGTKTTAVKDRLGDSYVNREGIFSQDKGANVFGNGYSKHHGLIGGTQ